VKRLLILALIVLACNGRSPTEPERRVQAEDAFPFAMEPAAVRLRPGQTRDVVIRAPSAYPLGVAFGSTDDAVIGVTGEIASGASEGVAHITAKAEGSAQVRLTVWNFGRPPGAREVGEVVVSSAPARRRSVAH
jgi:hypothetical protein